MYQFIFNRHSLFGFILVNLTVLSAILGHGLHQQHFRPYHLESLSERFDQNLSNIDAIINTDSLIGDGHLISSGTLVNQNKTTFGRIRALANGENQPDLGRIGNQLDALELMVNQLRMYHHQMRANLSDMHIVKRALTQFSTHLRHIYAQLLKSGINTNAADLVTHLEHQAVSALQVQTILSDSLEKNSLAAALLHAQLIHHIQTILEHNFTEINDPRATSQLEQARLALRESLQQTAQVFDQLPVTRIQSHVHQITQHLRAIPNLKTLNLYKVSWIEMHGLQLLMVCLIALALTIAWYSYFLGSGSCSGYSTPRYPLNPAHIKADQDALTLAEENLDTTRVMQSESSETSESHLETRIKPCDVS